MKALVPLLLCTALPPSAVAGGAHPLPVAYVCDSTNDSVWRLHDLDFNGDWEEAAEVREYYSDVVGTIPLTNPAACALLPDGVLLVADTTEDVIVALEDLDLDGDANDPGEHRIFFDGNAGGNASGVEMSSVADLFLAADGKLWVTTADNGAGGIDAVFWIEDLDQDGDANDANEAHVYYQLTTAAVGDSNPSGVVQGPDGALYYTDNGSTGVVAKGLWRLEDLDLSGTIDQPGEATLFFQPTAMAATPFYWDVTVSADGSFLMPDGGNELIWKARDVDRSGII
jgi:hypothetical protein